MRDPRYVAVVPGPAPVRPPPSKHKSRRCAEANTDLPVVEVSSAAGVLDGRKPCGRCC